MIRVTFQTSMFSGYTQADWAYTNYLDTATLTYSRGLPESQNVVSITGAHKLFKSYSSILWIACFMFVEDK